MNIAWRPLLTTHTEPVSPRHRSTAGLAPTDAIGARRASLPARMSFARSEFRLPLRHAPIAAKGALRMEVAGWTGYVLPAPCTRARLAVHSSRVRATGLGNLGARPRALLLRPLAGSGGWLPTDGTQPNGGLAPSRPERTGPRAIPHFRATVVRVVIPATRCTLARLGSLSHSSILRVQDRYCEVLL
jgi:hypothetical protein